MSKVILDYGGALDYGVPAGTYYSDPAGEIAALTAKLETAEKENARLETNITSESERLEQFIKDQKALITKQAAQIKALEKDAARYREPKWQPIETAPICGRLLAVMESGAMDVIIWLAEDHPCAEGAGWYEHWHFSKVTPTHWMPLPAIDAAMLGDSHV